MRIAITKLQEKSEGIPELFRQYGHEAVMISTMRAAEPTGSGLTSLADMVSKGEIDILIFTSALGVDKLFEKVIPDKKIRIVSVGPKTAKRVKEYGLSSETIKQFSSEHFADYFYDIKGKSIGIARAEVPDTKLVESLTLKGAKVYEAPAYRLVPSGLDITGTLENVDAVIFTSARSFEYSGFGRNRPGDIKVIAIGQKTADSMKKHGVVPDHVGNGTLESCLAGL